MDLFGIKRRKRKKEVANEILESYEISMAASAAARREREKKRIADAREENQRRHDEIDRVQNQQLTDSQITTNLGTFDTGIVLDGGHKHEHQHQDPPSPPPPAYDPPSDSGSSYDSGSSDSSSGSDYSGGSDF